MGCGPVPRIEFWGTEPRFKSKVHHTNTGCIEHEHIGCVKQYIQEKATKKEEEVN